MILVIPSHPDDNFDDNWWLYWGYWSVITIMINVYMFTLIQRRMILLNTGKMWLSVRGIVQLWIEIPDEQNVNLWHWEDRMESTVWKILFLTICCDEMNGKSNIISSNSVSERTRAVVWDWMNKVWFWGWLLFQLVQCTFERISLL